MSVFRQTCLYGFTKDRSLLIAETGFKPVSTICYNILFYHKQAAPTELISTFFKKLKCYDKK
ncbi:hypothetical protein KSMBR1_0929 [Candidatus Kuenenia stuttgartiensis]|jgi:hypothetical protein|uniref:Uncharacterized protein n=1 Tax=Kuenenia stuttgartiensis TaxID=174633 RepID=A0A2C9CCM7_KUEST|nr:hypothetical protein KSMBR1_0929 [Candidatus Kuenenia stuttgartiensis]